MIRDRVLMCIEENDVNDRKEIGKISIKSRTLKMSVTAYVNGTTVTVNTNSPQITINRWMNFKMFQYLDTISDLYIFQIRVNGFLLFSTVNTEPERFTDVAWKTPSNVYNSLIKNYYLVNLV